MSREAWNGLYDLSSSTARSRHKPIGFDKEAILLNRSTARSDRKGFPKLSQESLPGGERVFPCDSARLSIAFYQENILGFLNRALLLLTSDCLQTKNYGAAISRSVSRVDNTPIEK